LPEKIGLTCEITPGLRETASRRRCRAREVEFAGKHDLVSKQANISKSLDGIIKPPAYPFNARALLGNLRNCLAVSGGKSMHYGDLGRLMGKSKSTAHFWFDVHRNQNLLGFMALLERLSPQQRQIFIDSHCRVNPTLQDPSLAHAPSKRAKLLQLVKQTTGLTIVTGEQVPLRTFVFTALGNACHDAATGSATVAGIDLHSPRSFVPVLSLKYIDETLSRERIRQLVLKVWPRVLTSGTSLLCNGVWSSVPETREDLRRSTSLRHVILAEGWSSDFARFAKSASGPLHILLVSHERQRSGGIRIDCLRSGAGMPGDSGSNVRLCVQDLGQCSGTASKPA